MFKALQVLMVPREQLEQELQVRLVLLELVVPPEPLVLQELVLREQQVPLGLVLMEQLVPQVLV